MSGATLAALIAGMVTAGSTAAVLTQTRNLRVLHLARSAHQVSKKRMRKGRGQ